MKLLEKLDKKEFDNLIEVKFNNIEEGFNKYYSKTLTIVNEEDNNEKNFEKNFESYKKVFQELFYRENKEIIVDFYIKRIEGESILKLLENLNKEEGILLLNQINYINEDSIYFICKDLELLNLLIKLSLKELFFSTFYLKKQKITIWGNYNLKFPIFYKYAEDIQFLEKEILENSLVLY